MDENRKVSDKVKTEIMAKLVEPSYYKDVKETIRGRSCWRISGHVFETISKILLAVSGVLSFSAGVYNDKTLSFIAGTFSTVSLATFQLSSYSFKQNKKNTLELNQLLEKLDIEEVPVFDNNETMMMRREEDKEESSKKEDKNENKMEIEMEEFKNKNIENL